MLVGDVASLMPSNGHFRCTTCGRDFLSGEALRDHVTRRHPRDSDVRWWMAVEDPRVLKFG